MIPSSMRIAHSFITPPPAADPHSFLGRPSHPLCTTAESGGALALHGAGGHFTDKKAGFAQVSSSSYAYYYYYYHHYHYYYYYAYFCY